MKKLNVDCIHCVAGTSFNIWHIPHHIGIDNLNKAVSDCTTMPMSIGQDMSDLNPGSELNVAYECGICQSKQLLVHGNNQRVYERAKEKQTCSRHSTSTTDKESSP